MHSNMYCNFSNGSFGLVSSGFFHSIFTLFILYRNYAHFGDYLSCSSVLKFKWGKKIGSGVIPFEHNISTLFVSQMQKTIFKSTIERDIGDLMQWSLPIVGSWRSSQIFHQCCYGQQDRMHASHARATCCQRPSWHTDHPSGSQCELKKACPELNL